MMENGARITTNETKNKAVHFRYCVDRFAMAPCSRLISFHRTLKDV